jgi:hypothetical protein
VLALCNQREQIVGALVVDGAVQQHTPTALNRQLLVQRHALQLHAKRQYVDARRASCSASTEGRHVVAGDGDLAFDSAVGACGCGWRVQKVGRIDAARSKVGRTTREHNNASTARIGQRIGHQRQPLDELHRDVGRRAHSSLSIGTRVKQQLGGQRRIDKRMQRIDETVLTLAERTHKAQRLLIGRGERNRLSSRKRKRSNRIAHAEVIDGHGVGKDNQTNWHSGLQQSERVLDIVAQSLHRCTVQSTIENKQNRLHYRKKGEPRCKTYNLT